MGIFVIGRRGRSKLSGKGCWGVVEGLGEVFSVEICCREIRLAGCM
jgi:hypothetical protein